MINVHPLAFFKLHARQFRGGGGSSGSDAQGAAEEQLAGISQDQWNYYQNNWLPAATGAMQGANNANTAAENYYNGSYIPQAQGIENSIQAQAGVTESYDNSQAATDEAAAQAQFAQANTLNSATNQYGIGTLGEMSAQANQTGGQADQDYQAMLARGDVDQQFANTNASLVAKEQQAGVGANSGQMLAVMNQNSVQQAAAASQAQTQARMAAKQLGWTYKQQVEQDAAGLGSAASSAAASGTQASQAGVSASGAASSATQAPITGLNTVASGYNSAANAATGNLSNYDSLSSGLNGGASSASTSAQGAGGIAGQEAATQAQQSAATSNAIGTGIGAAAAIGTTAAVII